MGKLIDQRYSRTSIPESTGQFDQLSLDQEKQNESIEGIKLQISSIIKDRDFLNSIRSGSAAAFRYLNLPLGIDASNGLSLEGQQLSLGLASADSTGALYSGDWSNFNNKQNALTLGSLTSSTSGVTVTGGTEAVIGSGTSITIAVATGSRNGLLLASDWAAFNNKQSALTFGNLTSVTSGLTVVGGTGAVVGSGITLTIDTASGAQDGLLLAADWTTFNNKQEGLGFTPENVANKSTDTTLGVSNTLYPTQNAVKTYVDDKELGLVWHNPVEIINVIADTNTPVAGVNNDVYIINTGGNVGAWAAFAVGDMIQYQTDHWQFIKAMAVGDRFGVSFKSATVPYGSMTGYNDYLVQITGGVPGAFTYTFESPNNNDAVFVQNQNAYYHDVAFSYSTHIGGWVQLSATVDYSFGNGLNTVGLEISLGALTADWNQTGAFDIITAGDISVNGGDLKTSAGTALTVDSGTTGALNIGTGANAKTITIGSTSSTAVKIAKLTTQYGIVYTNTVDGGLAQVAAGTTGQCLLGNTGGAPSWGSCATGGVFTRTGTNISPTTSGDDLLLNSGEGLTIGGGTAITRHLSSTASLNFPAIPNNACTSLTITVTGAAVGDSVYSSPSAVAGGIETFTTTSWNSYVSAINTVTVRACKVGAIAADPANQTWRADVWQH